MAKTKRNKYKIGGKLKFHGFYDDPNAKIYVITDKTYKGKYIIDNESVWTEFEIDGLSKKIEKGSE